MKPLTLLIITVGLLLFPLGVLGSLYIPTGDAGKGLGKTVFTRR